MMADGRRALVTGADGFIGQALVRRFAGRGESVVGLDLRRPEVSAAAVRPVACDITDGRAVARVFEEQGPFDCVVHTAAVVDDFGDPSFFRRVNVEGTVNLLRAAREAGVRRFVHVSSIVVTGDEPGFGVDEESPYRPNGSPYTDTKIESEAVARQFHRRGELEVTVVRPGDVYGPGSIPWVVRPLVMMRDQQFLFFDEGRGLIATTYIENLVEGIAAASERPEAAGQVYILTDGVETTFRSYCSLLAAAAGFPPPKLSLPRDAALAAGFAAEKLFSLAGKKPPFSRAAVRWVARRASYSIEKARRELDYQPTVELQQGMERIREWLMALGGAQNLSVRRF